ncbi:MAG: PepSY-like domain-containing protein [Candidatus Omnitrophota bacterium]|nr:MAG: PepSY-like domain-containing protein [Candidatus Omnitrophota bacterium]
MFRQIVILFLVTCTIILNVSLAKEKEMPLSGVPQEVIDAAKEEIPGIKLIEAEMVTTDDGRTFYEIEGKLGREVYELKIKPEGKVLFAGHEKEIRLYKVPERVIAAAKRRVKGIRVIEAEKITKMNGEILYEIEGRVKGQTYELLITPKGKIIETDLEDDFDDEND